MLKGTDDDLPPSHPSRVPSAGRARGNGKSAKGASLGRQMTPEPKIRKLEQEAYTAVLRAFGAQAENITWAKESLMSELRKELRVSDEQHRDLLRKVAGDVRLRQIRGWRQIGDHIGSTMGPTLLPGVVSSPAILTSRKKQKAVHVLHTYPPSPTPPSILKPGSIKPSIFPSSTAGKKSLPGGLRGKKNKGVKPASVVSIMSKSSLVGALPARKGSKKVCRFSAPMTSRETSSITPHIDPWIGRMVKRRRPEDNTLHEAVIIDYDQEKGLHALTYPMNRYEEAWEWVNLKELSACDLVWVAAPPVSVNSKLPSSGGAVPPKGGAGMGLVKAGGQCGLLSPVGKLKALPKGHHSLEKSISAVAAPRNLRGPAPSDNGLKMAQLMGIQLPPLEDFVKEVDKIVGEEDLSKLEGAKRVAKKHEEMIQKALDEVGESSDEDADEGHPFSPPHSMEHVRERKSRQYIQDGHADANVDGTTYDGRGEGGVVSYGDADPHGGEGDDGVGDV